MIEPATAAPDQAARRRSIAFLNWAHALDHFVLLIYPTVVIGLEVIYQRPYAELIALSTAAFVAFGVFSLPAGWLADRWSRRNMMAAFYIGCGVSLAGIALAPNLIMLAVAHVRARRVRRHLSSGRHADADRSLAGARPHGGVQRRVRQSGRALAAGITAAIASWLGWRAAFLVPAVVCIVTGIVYLMLMPDDRHRAATRKTIADVLLSQRAAIIMFALFRRDRAHRRADVQHPLDRLAEDRRRAAGRGRAAAAGRLARNRGVHVRRAGAARGRPAGGVGHALPVVRGDRGAAIPRHPVGGQYAAA